MSGLIVCPNCEDNFEKYKFVVMHAETGAILKYTEDESRARKERSYLMRRSAIKKPGAIKQ